MPSANLQPQAFGKHTPHNEGADEHVGAFVFYLRVLRSWTELQKDTASQSKSKDENRTRWHWHMPDIPYTPTCGFSS